MTPGDFNHAALSIEDVLKNEFSIKLDDDHQICPDNLQPEGCALGRACPLRHVQPSKMNYAIKPPLPTNLKDREAAVTICKVSIDSWRSE